MAQNVLISQRKYPHVTSSVWAMLIYLVFYALSVGMSLILSPWLWLVVMVHHLILALFPWKRIVRLPRLEAEKQLEELELALLA